MARAQQLKRAKQPAVSNAALLNISRSHSIPNHHTVFPLANFFWPFPFNNCIQSIIRLILGIFVKRSVASPKLVIDPLLIAIRLNLLFDHFDSLLDNLLIRELLLIVLIVVLIL